jgi:chitinase
MKVPANNPPLVSITAPANNASFNAPASITFSANASDPDGNLSKVEYYNGSQLIGSATTSPFNVTWSNVAAGTYTITAKASDNLNAVTTSTAITITVKTVVANNPPAVSITAPANNASFNAPASITFSANATDSDGSVSKVEYFNSTQSLGSSTNSPYNVSWSNVAAGTYTITAKATDNSNAVTTSAAITVTVKAVVQNNPPAVSITAPANNASFNAPASITFSANATDSDGSVSKVEYFNGSQSIGSATVSPYTVTWSNVAAGTYTITAKATDNSNAITTSSAITVVVKTVSTDLCSGLPQYVENGGYADGSKVKNAGSSYQCKPYPYTGWCNGAAWAYAPGTGAYWSDAWTLVGSCTASATTPSMAVVSPNPATDYITINVNENSKVTVVNSQGAIVMTQAVSAHGTMIISSLPSGVYSVKVETATSVVTTMLSKY